MHDPPDERVGRSSDQPGSRPQEPQKKGKRKNSPSDQRRRARRNAERVARDIEAATHRR